MIQKEIFQLLLRVVLIRFEHPLRAQGKRMRIGRKRVLEGLSISAEIVTQELFILKKPLILKKRQRSLPDSVCLKGADAAL